MPLENSVVNELLPSDIGRFPSYVVPENGVSLSYLWGLIIVLGYVGSVLLIVVGLGALFHLGQYLGIPFRGIATMEVFGFPLLVYLAWLELSAVILSFIVPVDVNVHYRNIDRDVIPLTTTGLIAMMVFVLLTWMTTVQGYLWTHAGGVALMTAAFLSIASWLYVTFTRRIR